MHPVPDAATTRIDNPVVRYRPLLEHAARTIAAGRAPHDPHPPFALPAIDARWERFYAATPITVLELGAYHGHRLLMLDLMGNERTRTTKSLASATMVARAVASVRSTGQPLTIVTPTSGNKGTALRDAVGRAIDLGLVGPDELRVVMVVPRPSTGKLRHGLLDEQGLTGANPVVRAEVDLGAEVKQLAADAVALATPVVRARGHQLWYSLDLDNYRLADTVRAFVEAECVPPAGAGGPGRVHAHPVSSAFGLLGYALGVEVLRRAGDECGLRAPDPYPGFLLVQHLATPDMVLSLRHGSPDRSAMPAYTPAPAGGHLVQHGDRSFPAETDSADEQLDPTFYTAAPVTSAAMNRLIAAHGGDGIVVSRRECVARYAQIRGLLSAWHQLPADPADLREWSLVMGLCGVLNAVDRGVLDSGTEVLLHGSGCYWDALLPPFEPAAVRSVRTAADLAAVIVAGSG